MQFRRIIVGVDFSLTSPAACIIGTDETGRDHLRWVSIYYDENPDKLLKRESGAFYTLSRSETISTIVLEKGRKDGRTYSESERNKMSHAMGEAGELVGAVLNSIAGMTGGVAGRLGGIPVSVAMEGISFGSKGNTLIDICLATGIFRGLLLDTFGGPEQSGSFYFLSPTTVKAFAIHGSSDKSHLMHALMASEDPDVQGSELVRLMHDNRDLWVTAGGTVKKPVEDLSDATWVALATRAILNGQEIESVRRPKSKGSRRRRLKKK